MEQDTKRILLQTFETMLELEHDLAEKRINDEALTEALATLNPRFRKAFVAAREEAASHATADGVADRLHRLSEAVRHQRS